MPVQEMQRTLTGSLRPFRDWREDMNISATTGWRWRRDGLIQTITVAGRVYVTTAAIAEFERRAAAGEFAKVDAMEPKRLMPSPTIRQGTP